MGYFLLRFNILLLRLTRFVMLILEGNVQITIAAYLFKIIHIPCSKLLYIYIYIYVCVCVCVCVYVCVCAGIA